MQPGPGVGCFLGMTNGICQGAQRTWPTGSMLGLWGVTCQSKMFIFVSFAKYMFVFAFSAFSRTLSWLTWAPLLSGGHF